MQAKKRGVSPVVPRRFESAPTLSETKGMASDQRERVTVKQQ